MTRADELETLDKRDNSMQSEHERGEDKLNMNMSLAMQERIQSVTRQIVEQFHPQQVILFGSYAYGRPTADSDVDILVIMETDESPLHVAANIAAAIEHPFPLDVVVRTPGEFSSAVQRKSVFATEISAKGISLYEARNAGVD